MYNIVGQNTLVILELLYLQINRIDIGLKTWFWNKIKYDIYMLILILLAGWTWANYLNSLNLNFLINKNINNIGTNFIGLW